MRPQLPILFVSWRSPRTRTIHPVGRLVYREDQGLYEFVYIRKALEAAEEGFLPFLEFPDLDRIYLSRKLFPLFANRILSNNRPEFREYTEALGLSAESADPMRILARTGGRRETDQIEMFPLPEPDDGSGAYVTHCLIRGIRDMPQPFVEQRIAQLERDEPLFLLWDTQNEVDPNAVAVRTRDFMMLGYLPAYLARDVRRLDDTCLECSVRVERVNPPPAGVHHRLLCRVEGCWPKGFIPYDADEFQPLHPEATDIVARTASRAAAID
jgi:hypothetical protein